jgi:hypothetical protein
MPACAKLMIRLNWTAPRWEYNKPAYLKLMAEMDGTEPGMNLFIFLLMEMHLFRSQSSTI